ncbi:hypothetical protein [Ralstonia flaminis]|jgi:hypothetical protein|uniref:Transmembrane protein n=1 Tax=Ralstonia flaminis TaxID=3058597 RepID=A0ABN9JMQ3_9RALS|nr:hypothetical protein [Ralstonia sp. LMG 18101]CAJ0818174.1 hypothetical protein LMG18101_03520 [Ralstonia sp. LMG 18101]
MPVDFGRVPPRVSVPEPPRPSVPLWSVLFIVFVGAGIGLTVALWPIGKSTNVPLFWLCCLAYPVASWAFFLLLSLGHSHLQRDTALAGNFASERIEASCHQEASAPLAVLGHAWRFAGHKEANDVEGIVSCSTRLGAQSSGAEPGLEISARWLEVPGKPFYPGNALAEHDRHQVVSEWLIAELIEQITPGLIALPAGCALHVQLNVQSVLDIEDVRLGVEALLLAKAPVLQITTVVSEHELPLSEVDSWHDKLTRHDAHLLIAIQLRRAISERLADGDAEAGIALLVARPGVARQSVPSASLALHRPAIGPADAAAKVVSLALRWGQTEAPQVKTLWCHAPSEEQVRQVKSLPDFSPQVQWIDVGTSVGNCAGTGAWLTTALAIEYASRAASPQFVLSQSDHNMIALVCKKQV